MLWYFVTQSVHVVSECVGSAVAWLASFGSGMHFLMFHCITQLTNYVRSIFRTSLTDYLLEHHGLPPITHGVN